MHLTDEDVAHILRLIDQAPFAELELEWKGLVVRVTKRGVATADRQPSPGKLPPAPVASAPPRVPEPLRTGAPIPAAVPPGCVEVRAPVLGTFYRRPEPGQPPFVEDGSVVAKDDTLCLIEVMKVFTAVKADVDGTVEAILCEDAQLVEYGQALFVIRTRHP